MKFINWIKKNFFAGLIAALPFALTIYIIYFLIDKFDNFIGSYFAIYFPGIGLIAVSILIFVFGVLIRNIIGSKLLKYSELLIDRMPFINRIYKSIKHVTSSLIGSGNKIFKRVVLLEYPRKGIFSLGFVTEKMSSSFEILNGELNSEEYISVFVPTTPNPTSGYLIYIKDSDVIDLDVDVESAMKIVISGALVKRDFINNQIKKKGDDL